MQCTPGPQSLNMKDQTMTTNPEVQTVTLTTKPLPSATDAHLEPIRFGARGTLAEVIDATLGAIAREQHNDTHAPISSVIAGPAIGALKVGERVVCYTRNALAQLLERSHSQSEVFPADGNEQHRTSPTKFVDVALWARPALRSVMVNDAIQLAKPKLAREVRTFRTATDAHNPDPKLASRRYLRAIVSRRHSGAAGDDLVYLTELARFATEHSFASQFLTGKAYVERDPSGETVLGADSVEKLGHGARLTMKFGNNEIGEGSANVGLSLTFSVSSTREAQNEYGETYTDRLTVEIPGTNASEMSRHFGARPAVMFSAFAEKLAMVLMWAPGALTKLATASFETTRFDNMRATIARREATRVGKIDISVERSTQTAIGNFVERMSSDGHAPQGSALMAVLVAARFGLKYEASSLVAEFAGKP